MNEKNRIKDTELENVSGGRSLLPKEKEIVDKYEKQLNHDKINGLISADLYNQKMENLSDYKYLMKTYTISFEPRLFDENINWADELR